METGLRGDRVLITGGAGGIGSAIARTLAEEGAHVAIQYRTSSEAAGRLRDELQETFDILAPPLPADLRDELEVERMFEYALSALERLDGLVVNAGVWPEQSTPIARMSLEQWQDTLDVNLTGAFLCCRAFLRHLEARAAQGPAAPGGAVERASIVLIGSTAGIFGEEGHGDYAASKAALAGLMLTLKNEIVRICARGRVNLVHPGWVATPMAEAALEDQELVARVTSTMALRKVATADDVARAVVFLLSDRLAGHLSGASLPIAGGMEGRLLHPG
ncbi:MAG TPA: SDR family oxidoreductase [Thermoanaerobaculia bacterium]|nr:SDR family oxidoreductase [Thermoanaerobaculia bacterium]